MWIPPGTKDYKSLKYAAFITYTHTPNIGKSPRTCQKKWNDAKWPLLLILIDLEESKKFRIGKEFKNINASVFELGGQRTLRVVPSVAWNVESSKWPQEAPAW